jgi:hypothetical protein
LDVHAAMWHQNHPHVKVVASLHQDRLLGDAEDTLKRLRKGRLLTRLHAEARKANLEASRGRLKSGWIEPETLFWAVWNNLPAGEKVEIAEEAISGFVERVEQAASMDPRGARGDPMEVHRNRIHPLLWAALEKQNGQVAVGSVVARERDAWRARREEYLARRPAWSHGDDVPPGVVAESTKRKCRCKGVLGVFFQCGGRRSARVRLSSSIRLTSGTVGWRDTARPQAPPSFTSRRSCPCKRSSWRGR